MAEANSTEEQVIEPVAEHCNPETPTFKAFSWHADRFAPRHTLQSNAIDIGYGIATILEILELDILNKENGIRNLLNPADSGMLIRMAITSAKLLADSASSEIYYENSRAMNGSNGVNDDQQ